MTSLNHQHNAPTEELVHMNRHEVAALDNAQGGADYDKDGIRTFRKLGSQYQNPNMIELLSHHAREHKANGGHLGMPTHLSEMRKMGRYGDDMLVRLPKNLIHVFDRDIGGASINPHTGKREYFLGALAMGLTRLLPMAARAIPALGRLFGSAAPTIAKGAQAAGRGVMQAGRAMQGAGRTMAANPTMQRFGRAGMNAGRGLYKTAQVAGNIANAALPMSMLYDRFGGGQQNPVEPNNYDSAYNEEFGQPQGRGYNQQYDPNEMMMDLGNQGGTPSYNGGYSSQSSYPTNQYSNGGYNQSQYNSSSMGNYQPNYGSSSYSSYPSGRYGQQQSSQYGMDSGYDYSPSYQNTGGYGYNQTQQTPPMQSSVPTMPSRIYRSS